jgi:hypothetical protein
MTVMADESGVVRPVETDIVVETGRFKEATGDETAIPEKGWN